MSGQEQGGDGDRTPERDERPTFDPYRRNALSGTAGVAGAGLQFAIALLLFLFLGQWLDRRLGTDPWLMMLGVFLGGGAGFWAMYRSLMANQAREEAERKRQRRP